jgi:hypothetical protein
VSCKLPRPLNTPLTFFLDRNLGKFELAQALRAKGAVVEIHSDHFKHDAPDNEWLIEIWRRRWILLSKDKHILTRPLEVLALLQANLHAFILRENRNQNLTGSQLATAYVAAYDQMVGLVKSTAPPVIAQITATGKVSRIEGYSNLQARALKALRLK